MTPTESYLHRRDQFMMSLINRAQAIDRENERKRREHYSGWF